ncbi:TPA: enoyl-CoA hydratase/isomerase family protein [Pseudomonas aeruginosa]|jgi:enoyl-CoA hydratase/carnithine racemase|uniref:enoyl-CoA hydratase/isomerase family protein n=1 Tax=Pseudomonas TaxID=286 RepID=UPI00053DC019|nr:MULTISPECIES: enoyl-CoA hydratase/isomerase family protein [Pseudomonas]AKO86323.1 enoyl-CoA hydratase [Pseudomonas aeruginosa DSM 50071 = NBRC 12689]AXN23918.1 enoyl-CoA hydratase/isomerase family protein [Pseudomonas aeruginosa]EJH4832359.1 enoyl-CoA hydratase/isomerase family protein [Pseudomonas aeruginosa]EKU9561308.1 enoyl-CoA hydratase/isomerase family protein [Pseudomonas aeruginosa]EKV6497039.1 enoyl-CoA hydratase/isomerase family protein [Pseudomonas aeruginosa]
MTLAPRHLRIEQRGRVLQVLLDNPPANFLTTAVMQELADLLEDLEQRQDIGAVILSGAADGVFLTHFDVDEIERAVAPITFSMPAWLTRLLLESESLLRHLPGARKLLRRTLLAGVADMNLFHEVTAHMRRMDKVFIAAINGLALGGGCELALACDLRLMAEDDQVERFLGQPEVLIGLIPGGGGTQMLARSLGVARALELCLEGQLLEPRQALALGLVKGLAPAEELLEAADALAQRLSRRSPQAVRLIKRSIYQAASRDWTEGMASEKAGFLSAASQGNTRRAMREYIERVRTITREERPFRRADFDDLTEGNAIDMAYR